MLLTNSLIPPLKKILWMLSVCVDAAQPQSVFVWPSTGNSTTQLTDIMQAQLHRWSPSLSQEFALILAQRILLTLENDQPHGQVRPQKKKKINKRNEAILS